MSKKSVKESFGMGFGDLFCDCESDPVEYNGRTYDTWTMYGGEEVGDVMFADDALRQDMEENGIDQEIMKMVDVWVNPRDRVEDAIDQITSDEMYTEGGVYWPTPKEERTPIFTIELSRIDDDEAYVETPMKYSKIYHSDDEAFEDAEKLAAEYANEDGKFEVHIMAGEYQIGDGEDIYGDPYVDGSIQTGRGWKMVKEGFMSNIGKDGQRLYSIIYKFDGWDGSVQEYGKSEEDAVQAAIAKGKLDDEDEIVKVVDLGEKGEYLESRKFNEKSVPYMILAELVKITAAGEKTIKVDEVPSYKMAFEMLQDYILEDPDMDDYVVEKYEDYMTGRDVRGKEKEICLLEKNGEIGERCVSGFYEIVLRAAEQANPNERLDDYFLDDDYYAESRKRKLAQESLDYTVSLRDIIKNDPTEFALAMDSLMDGLFAEVEKYSQVFRAIKYVSNPAIKEALMHAYAEAAKRTDEQH